MKASVIGTLMAATLINFSSGVASADEHAKEGSEHKCVNNTCKSKSECKGHGNDTCKGHNSCKGKGWLEAADAASCKKAGGKWAAK